MSRIRARLEKLEATSATPSRVVVVEGHSDAEHATKVEALKLETLHRSRDARMFVIEGSSPAERDAYIKDLIQSGTARQSDTFIHTGVPRSERAHTDCGTIPDLMERIATHGGKIHNPRH